jgi:hypothetical protein
MSAVKSPATYRDMADTALAAVNDNSSRSSPTTIVQNFDFSGTDTNNARRSRRQFAQGFGQTAAAMSR